MKTARLFWALTGLCGAALFGASFAQAAIVIDPFTSFQEIIVEDSTPGPASGSASLDPAGVLGGERDILVNRTSANSGTVSVDVNGTEPGGISYSSGTATSGKGLIVYDGPDADPTTINPTGLGGVDLTQGGSNQWFEVSAKSDLGGNVVITVYTDATHFSTASVSAPTGPFTLSQVTFASFTAAGADGGANFANVGAITLLIDGENKAALDLVINYFGTGGIPPQGFDPPTCTRPTDITVEIGASDTSAVVVFPDPVVTVDPDCEPATVAFVPPSGSSFPVGTTEVNLIVTDHCGQAALCNFTVTVTKPAFLPLSPGYWKNHTDAWPVTTLTLGSQTYTQAELLKIMARPGGDASTILAFQLIAAKLNLLSGANPTQISGLVSQGDALLSLYSGKLPYKVKTSSSIGQQMTGIGGSLSALWF